jgi:hypothetical protein
MITNSWKGTTVYQCYRDSCPARVEIVADNESKELVVYHLPYPESPLNQQLNLPSHSYYQLSGSQQKNFTHIISKHKIIVSTDFIPIPLQGYSSLGLTLLQKLLKLKPFI